MSGAPKIVATGAAAVLALLLVALAGLWWLNVRDESPAPAADAAWTPTAAQVERGAYLARAGDCAACHTPRGGAPYAGGRRLETPFGALLSTNITPDPEHGIGRWSPADFWRALHNGRSKDGRLLYPAFPYPNTTLVTREDSDALFAYLRSLPPVAQPNAAHELRFPYDTQLALAAWRALFFTPGVYQPQAGQSAQWNRGAYLVRGLGHCNACHGERNALGATSQAPGLEFSGSLIPVQNWYAPSLGAAQEAGVHDWPSADIVALLKTGLSPRGSVLGPMAEVVYRGTQYLSEADLQAIAAFLKALPQTAAPAAAAPAAGGLQGRGATVYGEQCAGCHGRDGQGAPGAYPALAGNRAVTMAEPANVLQVVVNGGFLPATAGNPRPYGMPPFAHVLNDADIAAVVSYIRGAWGNAAAPVSSLQVLQHRRGR